MIKSLLGEEETTKQEKSDKKEDVSLKEREASEQREATEPEPMSVEPFEISTPIGKPKAIEPSKPVAHRRSESSPALLELDKPLTTERTLTETKPEAKPSLAQTETSEKVRPPVQTSSKSTSDDSDSIHILRKDFKPDSAGETVRKTGLAWSAAIILFGSVAFMMLLGWFVDLQFATQPWGVVGGIILGAVIGFVQFFRTTAQILKPPKEELKNNPLFLSGNDK